jgi:4'-phosphopantetheinyl transferase
MREDEVPSLAQDEVHLWHTSVADFITTPIERWTELLCEDELQRFQSIVSQRLQNEYVLARALCRITLSRYEPSIPPRMWRFERNPWGRPHVVLPSNARPLDFNLAHSYGVVVMAVTYLGREVGVDLEAVDPAHAGLDIARLYFAPTELAAIQRLPLVHQVERFFEIWSAKEAYIKARGFGLSMALNAFAIDIERGRSEGSIAAHLTSTPQDDDPRLWQFLVSDLPPRHKLALCVRRTNPDKCVRVRWFPFKPQC